MGYLEHFKSEVPIGDPSGAARLAARKIKVKPRKEVHI